MGNRKQTVLIRLLPCLLLAGSLGCDKKTSRPAARSASPTNCLPTGSGGGSTSQAGNNVKAYAPAPVLPTQLALTSVNELEKPTVKPENKGYGLTYTSVNLTCDIDSEAHLCVFRVCDSANSSNCYPRANDGSSTLWYSMTRSFQEAPQTPELSGKNVIYRAKQCIQIANTKEAHPSNQMTGNQVFLVKRDPASGVVVRLDYSGLLSEISKDPLLYICTSDPKDNLATSGMQLAAGAGQQDTVAYFKYPHSCSADKETCDNILKSLVTTYNAENGDCPANLAKLQDAARKAYAQCQRFSLDEDAPKTQEDQWCDFIGSMGSMPATDAENYYCHSDSRNDVAASTSEVNQNAQAEGARLALAAGGLPVQGASSGLNANLPGCDSDGTAEATLPGGSTKGTDFSESSGYGDIDTSITPPSTSKTTKPSSTSTAPSTSGKTGSTGTSDTESTTSTAEEDTTSTGGASEEEEQEEEDKGGLFGVSTGKLIAYGIGAGAIVFGLHKLGVTNWIAGKVGDYRNAAKTNDKYKNALDSSWQELRASEKTGEVSRASVEKFQKQFDNHLEKTIEYNKKINPNFDELKFREASMGEFLKDNKGATIKLSELDAHFKSKLDFDPSQKQKFDIDNMKFGDIEVNPKGLDTSTKGIDDVSKTKTGEIETGKKGGSSWGSGLLFIGAGVVSILIGNGLELAQTNKAIEAAQNLDGQIEKVILPAYIDTLNRASEAKESIFDNIQKEVEYVE